MTTSAREKTQAFARTVEVGADALTVGLSDGRTLTAPLAWFPRLLHGTALERSNWRFIGRGLGIHWPDLDEDVSVAGLLAGHPSGESQESLARWLASRPRAARRGPRRSSRGR